MRIALLGPLVIAGGGGKVGPRDRVVLAALAVRPGEVYSADRLADALWGDRPPASSKKVVQGCVARLRKAVGPETIETLTHGYRLQVSSEELDTLLFEHLVGRGRELLTVGEAERASYTLGQALDLWRGEAFVDLNGWEPGRVEAGRLDELRLDSEEIRLDGALQAGHHLEVLAEAQDLVAAAPLRERRWGLLALAQYQAGRQAEALRTLRRVRTVLTNELGLDPSPDLVALEQAILQQDPNLLVEPAVREPSAVCPYRGLLPYDIDDSDTFFGRDADLAACLERLSTVGVLAVVGPSGSGKSSLVRAGVAATYRRDGHRTVVITPGAHPMDALTAIPDKGPTPLLIVDQFEGAFSLCEDQDERTRFFAALAEHADKGKLVMALRADRMGDVSAHPEVSRLIERGLYLLGAMAEDELRAAIEGPARQAGLPIEPGLVDLLVHEVEGEPGALPLLSHALRETWLRREGRTLTVEGYQATGGIRGAVAQSAEDVYERVDPDQQDTFRDLLLRLVIPSEAGEPVRSRLPRRLVATDEEREQLIEQLVGARLVTSDDGVVELTHEALVRAWPRLREWLDEDADGQRIRHHITVAADAWEGMDRPDSELYRGVRLTRALDWRDRAAPRLTATEQAFLDASHAHAEDKLRDAVQRAEREARVGRRTRRLAIGLAGVLVLALVAAGLALRYQHDAAARANEATEASTLADANRLAALSTTADELDVSLLLAAEAARTADTPETRSGLLNALVEHRRAIRVDRRVGVSDLDLGQHGEMMFADLYTSVVAWPTGSSSRPVTVTDDWYGPYNVDASPTDDLVSVLGWVGDDIRAGVFTADGEPRMVMSANRSSIVIFGADGKRERLIRGSLWAGWPLEVAFSPDGRGLLFAEMMDTPQGGLQSTVQRFDLASGAVRTLQTGAVQSPNRAYLDATFSDDGGSVAMWVTEEDGAASVIDLRDGSQTGLHLDSWPADSTEFVPLPDGAAQLWSDGAVTLYNDRGRPTQMLDVHRLPVTDVLVSPSGTWATTTGEDGQVVLWDVDQATGLWSQSETLTGHGGAVWSAELAPDGRTLMTASLDHRVITWDVSPDAGFGSAYRGLDDRWIANRPQLAGGLLVAPSRPVSRLGEGGSTPARDTLRVAATFLDPATGRRVDQVFVGTTYAEGFFASAVAVSPSGQQVAVSSGFATTVLDTRTREVLGRIELPPTGARGPDGTPYPHERAVATGWTTGGEQLLLGVEGRARDNHDGGLVVVDPATWEPVRRVPLGVPVQDMELSPDQRLLAVASAPAMDGSGPDVVWLRDAATLKPVRTLHLARDDFPHDVSFSPDGKRLAVGGRFGTVSVFDVATGELVHEPINLHDSFIQQVEWLPDGHTVVTSAADGTAAVYDAERDLAIAVGLPGSSDLEKSSNLKQGYTHLVPGTSNEIIVLSGERPGHRYPMEPSVWLADACKIVGRDLTRDEWDRYLPDRPYRHTCSDL
jgi:WD40 repeat protein/DNA-binding SARP family transcriptional activator